MKSLTKGSQDPARSKSQIVLNFLNNATTAEQIGDHMNTDLGLSEKYELSNLILNTRDKLGGSKILSN